MIHVFLYCNALQYVHLSIVGIFHNSGKHGNQFLNLQPVPILILYPDTHNTDTKLLHCSDKTHLSEITQMPISFCI